MSLRTARTHLRDLGGIVLGSMVSAAATTFFITNCGLIPGGVFIISGLIVLAGLFLLGRESFAKTVFCITIFSGMLELSSRFLPAFPGSLWLAAILGGLFIGVGLGLILLCRGSLGTTDLIGQILNKHFGWSVSAVILVLDIMPMLLGAYLFGAGTLPYAVACLVMITLAVALFQRMRSSAIS